MEDKKELSIDLTADIAQGKYSNLALITHSHSEFILDFIQMMPGIPKPTVVSRVVLAPEHAKRLLRALSDNVSKYESEFGTIKIDNGTPVPPISPMGFSGEA
ncbi:MAG: DUF3467 domain-containing protein [Bacteroidales bacterium]|nr:DUF3467 domain-containing protein [Bacteroidales bacterium]